VFLFFLAHWQVDDDRRLRAGGAAVAHGAVHGSVHGVVVVIELMGELDWVQVK